MATSSVKYSLYNKNNMSRIMILVKGFAGIIKKSIKSFMQYDLSRVAVAYRISGADLIGCRVKPLPLDCSFLKLNRTYEVYEFVNKSNNSKNKHIGNFLTIIKDTTNNKYYIGTMNVFYKKTQTNKFETKCIFSYNSVVSDYNYNKKLYITNDLVYTLKPKKKYIFDYHKIREKEYNKNFKR